MAGIWYRAGAVSVTSGSKKVTGFGTQWQTSTWKVEKGHAWYGPDGKPYEIDYVESDTVLYLVTAYAGPTAASQSYAIDITRTGTIPAFSRQLSAQLAYAQGQFESWQQILTGADMVTLTAPDGQQVQVPSLSAFQPTSASLKALQALTPVKDKIPVFNGSTGAELITLTAFMRTLLDDASLTDTQKTLKLPTAGGFGFRNRLINGAMQIAQRGLNGNTNSGLYCLDRWALSAAGAPIDWSQQSGPSGSTYASLQFSGSAGNTGVYLNQRIEAVNCVGLIGKKLTLSLKGLTDIVGGIAPMVVIAYPNARDDYSSVTNIQVVPSGVNIPGGGAWSGTLSFTFEPLPSGVNNGLLLSFNFPGIPDGKSVAISEVQLEVGEVATPFEHRPYQTELALCQRYYIGQVTTHASNNDNVWCASRFPEVANMRALPTVTTGAVYNGASGEVIMSDRTWSFTNLMQVGSFYINIAGKPNLPPIGGWIGVTVYSFSAEL
ncbi:hypothetical protein U1437_10790 [Aeromonas caviae]|uniref:hypothetical protein n=1 Tax=Aeromonas caviae TaxID=648 RepID=UPI0030148DFE